MPSIVSFNLTSCEVEAKDEKRAIMSDEFYMTRTNNAISTETERIVEAIQVIVNVSKKNSINKSRICERFQASKNEVFQIYIHC